MMPETRAGTGTEAAGASRTRVALGVAVLGVALLSSLVMLSDAMQDSTRFGSIYSLLLLINAVGLLAFLALIFTQVRQLLREMRANRPGARLKRRMAILFVALGVTPVLVVYGFSLDFLRRGIDSWFDVKIEQALADSLDLSRAALDLRMRELLRQTRQLAERLDDGGATLGAVDLQQLRLPESIAVENAFAPPTIDLDGLRQQSGAEEMTLITAKGSIIAHSSAVSEFAPSLPSETILLQLRQSANYIGLEPIGDFGLYIRIVVNVPDYRARGEARILQALYPVAARMTRLADTVQDAFAQYKELAYLREQLKVSFTLTLTLVLLFSIAAAVWAAFYSAERLAAPIRDLAEGTRAVAEGNYETTLRVPGADDIGVLVESFNDMTWRIGLARDEARRSRDEVEAQRAHLETVLSRLSSGVLTLDRSAGLLTFNHAAGQILGLALEPQAGRTLAQLAAQSPHLKPLADDVEARLAADAAEWQAQVMLFGQGGRRVLMCRGARLTAPGDEPAGHVIVFDDVTALIQGQRDAAWSEVARRLAHEIKNPLTPIQLSAERLRHKYLRTLSAADAETLDRLTHTIIQQVETMKGMVNTFSEYARSPKMQQEPVQLNSVIGQALDLYRSDDARATIETAFDPQVPTLYADPNRLRQVVNNLVKNAIEAQAEKPASRIEVSTRLIEDASAPAVEIRVRDCGTGIPAEILGHLFEPYVTSKPRGTGLGLAIVKKIVEEHGGIVWMENNEDGTGATAVIRLPVSGRGEGSAGIAPVANNNEREQAA